MSERPQQFVGFAFSVRDIERLIDLPRDHRIVKIEMTFPHTAPGISIIVEGPGGQLVAERCPVAYQNYDDWREHLDETREFALEKLGPYEW